MHFAKLDLIPSQQFRGVSLPVTFHITLFIAETGVPPRTAGTRETALSPVSKEASRAIAIFSSSSLLLACCRVQRRDQADDMGEETSDRMTSLGLNQKQPADLHVEQGPSFPVLVQACSEHRNNGANTLFIIESQSFSLLAPLPGVSGGGGAARTMVWSCCCLNRGEKSAAGSGLALM